MGRISFGQADIILYFLYFFSLPFQYMSAPWTWEDQWVDEQDFVADRIYNYGIGELFTGALYNMGSRWESETSTAILDDAPTCLSQLVVNGLTWNLFLLEHTFDLAIL